MIMINLPLALVGSISVADWGIIMLMVCLGHLMDRYWWTVYKLLQHALLKS